MSMPRADQQFVLVTVSSLFKEKGPDLWVSYTFVVSKEISTVYEDKRENQVLYNLERQSYDYPSCWPSKS